MLYTVLKFCKFIVRGLCVYNANVINLNAILYNLYTFCLQLPEIDSNINRIKRTDDSHYQYNQLGLRRKLFCMVSTIHESITVINITWPINIPRKRQIPHYFVSYCLNPSWQSFVENTNRLVLAQAQYTSTVRWPGHRRLKRCRQVARER